MAVRGGGGDINVMSRSLAVEEVHIGLHSGYAGSRKNILTKFCFEIQNAGRKC